MSNMFAGLRDAKTFDRGIFLKPGKYEVRVKKAIWKLTRKQYHAYILEFSIVKSDYEVAKKKAIAALGSTPYSLQELEKTLPNAEGTSASWFQSCQDMDIGFGALKSFAANITGQSVESKEFIESVEEFLEQTTVEGGGVIDGMLIPLEVIEIKTKKNEPFSLHKWAPIIEEAAPAQASG